MERGVVRGTKKLTKIGNSVVLIINQVLLNGSGITSGDLINFRIKKVENAKEK